MLKWLLSLFRRRSVGQALSRKAAYEQWCATRCDYAKLPMQTYSESLCAGACVAAHVDPESMRGKVVAASIREGLRRWNRVACASARLDHKRRMKAEASQLREMAWPQVRSEACGFGFTTILIWFVVWPLFKAAIWWLVQRYYSNRQEVQTAVREVGTV